MDDFEERFALESVIIHFTRIITLIMSVLLSPCVVKTSQGCIGRNLLKLGSNTLTGN